MAKWIRKYNSNIYCLQETHFKYNNIDIYGKRLEKIEYTNVNKRKGMSILISEKVDIIAKKKKNTRNRYGHYIKVKVLIKQEDIAILNMLAPNNRAAKYVEQRT